MQGMSLEGPTTTFSSLDFDELLDKVRRAAERKRSIPEPGFSPLPTAARGSCSPRPRARAVQRGTGWCSGCIFFCPLCWRPWWWPQPSPTPPLAALLAAMVLFLAVCSARGLMGNLSRAEEARNSLNSQLIQSQKLAAVGELSAGIAHEINNPIAIIAQEASGPRTFCPRWKQCTADLADVRNSREIRSQVDRCKNITHKLLDFAQREPVLQEVDVARLVDDMARLVDKEASYKTSLARVLPEDLPAHTDARCCAGGY